MTKAFFLAGLALVLAGPALAQERQWTLDATDHQAFLVFGVPDTDDVGLSFWCDVGGSTLSAYMPDSFAKLKSGERTKMVLSVDGAKFTLTATAAKDQTANRMTVEGKFKVSDALTKALQNGETVGVAIKGHSATYPLTDADFEGLLNACSGADSGQ
ncbi:MAG: hypothetical protein KGO53_01270 [Alphaproteobacteria bacterium]|nr:hypothetical protein [Alphaproteobacteria bacterium]